MDVDVPEKTIHAQNSNSALETLKSGPDSETNEPTSVSVEPQPTQASTLLWIICARSVGAGGEVAASPYLVMTRVTDSAAAQDEVQLDAENMSGLTGDALRIRAGARGESIVGKRTHFSLLGALGIDEMEDQPDVKLAQTDVMEPEKITGMDEIVAGENLFAKPKMFFFHFDDAELSKRSIYEPTYTFMRTSSIEDIQRDWEASRRELTLEFKRKHRSAARRSHRSHRGAQPKGFGKSTET
ncbi:hypothetical protein BC829DRAFT_401816 [Chytridium lagenaria]|nr:hypothetical protein BC829DRAFT_401816 [Chytridium lagenaria]